MKFCALVLLGVLSLSGLVLAGDVWVNFNESYWCPIGGDTFSGVAIGEPGYSAGLQETSGGQLFGALASLKPQAGTQIADLFCGGDGMPWYNSWDANGGALAAVQLQGGNNVWLNAMRAQPCQVIDTGVTVTRTVTNPVLTADIETRQATLTLRLDRALDASINRIEVDLWQTGNEGVNVELLGSLAPSQFTGGGSWYYASPAALTVGQTYTFTFNYRVTRTGEWSGRPCYFKPRMQVILAHHESLTPQTAPFVTLTTGTGAQVLLGTAQTMNYTGQIQWNRTELVFESILDHVGPAQVDNVFLTRGCNRYLGKDVYEVGCEVTGDCLAAVTLTTPTGKVVPLVCDGPGEWEGSLYAASEAGLSDFPMGVYTLTCQSTDGSAPLVTQFDTSSLTTDPAEFPVLTGPLGATTDTTPELTWNAVTDPNVNMIYAGIEAGFESDDGAGQMLPPDATSLPVGSPLSLGGYQLFVAFGQGCAGTTPEGVSYQAVRYKGRSACCNITPFLVTAALDHSWVYENTPTTTAWRHRTVLHLAVSGDAAAPQDYAVMATDRGGLRNVLVMEGGDSLTRTLVGGLRGNCTPDQISVDVLVRGTTSLQAAPAVVTLTLRKLGDVDGDGLVNASDKLEINKKLNGLSTLPGIELRNLDLSGDGVLVNAEDKLAINQVLNGLAVP